MGATPPAEPLSGPGSPVLAPTESPLSDATPNGSPDVLRPVIVYTRPQLVHMSKSPLVAPPKDMPDLKEWFGSDVDHAHKRDTEPTTPNRERRFRRDQDDGESSSRPSFRSGLSQPSQMGNFKHHSLRGSDREDRERDTNERLRNLSDKFDRDRLGLPMSGLRGKDRDAAPHLSNRLGNGSTSTIASRRADARDATKKKTGEANEDWRSKGSERGERARSRPRDSSRSRRDHSTSRREDRDRRRTERDTEDDDARRWRDDGKRDERIAARRERGQRDKEKDKDDSRWSVTEDSRETRNRRNGREKRDKEGAKDSEDRKDRDRDQKEPAWMETYVPVDDTPGILGGSTDGQLDGIQAWKKGVQEKEQKEKDKQKTPVPSEPADEKLDEIQLFRMLMEKEQRKPTAPVVDGPPPGLMADPAVAALSAPAPPIERPEVNHGPPVPTGPPPQSLLSLLAGEKSALSPVNGSGSSSDMPAKSRFFPKPLGHTKLPDTQHDPAVLSSSSPRPPSNPSISRLPPLGRPPSVPSSMEQLPPIQGMHPNPAALDFPQSTFTPFEEARLHAMQQQHPSHGHDDLIVLENQRLQDRGNSQFGDRSIGLAVDPSKGGSRYAKFFDGRTREHVARNAGGAGILPGRADVLANRPVLNDHHAMDDIFSMLNNSAQNPRLGPPGNSALVNDLQRLSVGGPQFSGHHISNQPPPPLPHQPLPNDRLESFYDSRLDDQNFVPNGLVPGLRTAPPPRDRLYQEALDDQVRYNGRIPPPRGLEPMFGNGPGFPPGRNLNLPPNQGQFRGGPSPHMQSSGQQRLPPGLANLGGRPPHDASLMGLQGGLHGPPGGGAPQQFSGIHSFSGPMRGPTPGGQLGGLPPHLNTQQNQIDLRLANQQQQQHLLAMGGSNPNIRGGGGGPGFGSQSAFANPHNVRQTSQGLPPHLLAQHQQGPPLGPPQHNLVNNGGTSQDLMAILLNGQPH